VKLNKDTYEKCYWCSEPAIGIEHVPPQNLFPKGHRKDLITVPACNQHNQDFSKIDERIRFHMTSMGGESKLAMKHFDTKTIRGLKRKESLGLTIDLVQNRFTTPEGKTHSREKAENWDLYFEKIIKGIYYYHFKRNLISTTHFFSNKMTVLSLSANAHFYYHLLEYELAEFWIEGNSKNKEVFDYKYYYSESEKRFFTVMTFYENHKVIGLSLPIGKKIDDYGLDFEVYKERIEEMNKNKQ